MMKNNHSIAPLTLAALGIVYGDIGTSPLYTLKESFIASKLEVDEMNILGFVSLITWALLLIVTLKYVLFVLRADHNGEGGVVVLMQQTLQHVSTRGGFWVTMAGLMGASLFLGDAMITPAISVLSAVEGLTVVNPALEHWIVPIALVILFTLFMVQRTGTQKIGTFFGPIMLLWFSLLALIGVYQISMNPHILLALNPYYGIYFATHHGWGSFLGLGAVVLAITGAEALYADMGHFGRLPIQVAWLGMVLPALMLNYMGQGAMLLSQPQAIANPFFNSVPAWGLLPLIALATVATVIASQAVISGAYSLMQQAIQLGFAPRMLIKHTNNNEIGQIYMPAVNWLLLGMVVAVVLIFQSSTNLAAAYGIAATGTMVFTTLMFCVVMRRKWQWSKAVVVGLTAVFLLFDLTFLSSNLLKIPSGGWFPLLVAGGLVFIFTTWYTGRALLNRLHAQDSLDLDYLLQNLAEYPPQVVAGNAVFMVGNPYIVPQALLHNLKHNKVLHQCNVLLSIRTTNTPYVAAEARLKVEHLNDFFVRVTACYGFQETPNIRHVLFLCRKQGLHLEMMETSFFLSSESIVLAKHTPKNHMNRLRTLVFRSLYRNSASATSFYHIPDNRVVEMGSQVKL